MLYSENENFIAFSGHYLTKVKRGIVNVCLMVFVTPFSNTAQPFFAASCADMDCVVFSVNDDLINQGHQGSLISL